MNCCLIVFRIKQTVGVDVDETWDHPSASPDFGRCAMPLKPMEVIGLLAMVIAPIVALMLPAGVANKVVAAHATVKDLVLLALLMILAIAVLLDQFVDLLWRGIRLSPFYQNAEFSYFYLPDGTVITRSRYDLVNGWSRTRFLPSEHLIWHRPISESDIVYRLYARGRFNDRRIVSDPPSIQMTQPHAESAGQDFRYRWQPRVTPGLGIKESLSYVVEIVADKTEVDAFKPGGTKLGFGFDIPASKASLTAYAPFNHKFVLLDPVVTVRESENLTEVPNSSATAPAARISPDGTILTVFQKRPKSGRRYWVHYRFEKLSHREEV
jgi:hypothetical protein